MLAPTQLTPDGLEPHLTVTTVLSLGQSLESDMLVTSTGQSAPQLLTVSPQPHVPSPQWSIHVLAEHIFVPEQVPSGTQLPSRQHWPAAQSA
jgi:hypothetical protein